MQSSDAGYRGRVRILGLVLAAAIALAACGTPEAVKTLSQSQLEAFDAAIANAEIQGNAIVALARKVRDAQVDAFEANLAQGLAKDVDELSRVEDRKAALEAAFVEGGKRARQAAELRASLDAKIARMDELTSRLVTLIREMKVAQAAIHRYLETETVGQKLGDQILGNPIVSSAIGTASRFLTEINETSTELKGLVDSVVSETASGG